MYVVCSPPPFPDCYRRRTKQGTLDLFLRRMSSLHGILTWDSCTWLVVSEFQPKCISIFQHWLQIPGSILIKELMGLDRCSYLFIFVLFFLFQFLKRKYNARDFDKSKAANLLKIMKGEHPTKKWQNCGTEVLCVMLFYSGADLARIVNKVLGMEFVFF